MFWPNPSITHDPERHIGGYYHDPYAAAISRVSTGRAVLAICYDDAPSTDYTTILALHTARFLPGTLAVPARFLDASGNLTTAQALEMQAKGFEVGCHSATHDYSIPLDDWYGETLGARDLLRDKGFHADSFVYPGTWPTTMIPTSLDELSAARLDAITNGFDNSWGTIPDPLKANNNTSHYPRIYKHGLGRINEGIQSLGAAQTDVDNLLLRSGCLIAACHSALLGTGGANMSVANWTSFLDYIQTRRNNGNLDVVTLTGLSRGRIESPRPNILMDGDFALSATAAWVGWAIGAGAPTVVADGIGSSNSAHVNNANYIQQVLPARGFRGLQLDFFAANAIGGSAANPKIQVSTIDATNSVLYTYDIDFGTGQDAFTHYRAPIVIRRDAFAVRILLYNNSGANSTKYDAMNLYAI